METLMLAACLFNGGCFPSSERGLDTMVEQDYPCDRGTWKSGGKSAAQMDPLSVLYDEMRRWAPMEGHVAQSAVLVMATSTQAAILSRACFGTLVLPAAAPSKVALRDAHLPARPARILDVQEKSDGLMMHLGLEEAFFLCHHMGCLHIYSFGPEGQKLLTCAELWTCMVRGRAFFRQRYKGFLYLRERHWVVRSGHQYGADFLAYRHHPELVHSQYAVIIVPEGEQRQRVANWADVHAMNRLCGSVSKTLLLLYVVPRVTSFSGLLIQDLESLEVKPVEVRRWLPESHRSDSESQSVKRSGTQDSSVQDGR